MTRRLRRAAVLGAGTMGSQIAAHLANAGIPTLLLDIVPPDLTDEERRRGLTFESPEVRNRFASGGLQRALRANPAAFFVPQRAQLITIGNLEDDLGAIADADWIIEAVVEDLGIKQDLLARVEAHRREDAVVSTNTSGLPVHQVADGRGAAFRRHFLGTHFFNPPRYLKLLEVISLPDTDPGVVQAVALWGERRLGKGIVYAHDRPNFIANRLGTYGFLKVVQLMLELGLTVEEVDELTGPLLGRPRSATFRTTDIVGLDVLMHVAENAYVNLPDDEERELFIVPSFFHELVKRGWLGEKTGAGFYKRVDGDIHALDWQALEYRPRRKAALPVVEQARLIDDPAKRMAALLADKGKAGEFLWRLTSSLLVYAARRVPEIADDVVNVDRAMRWGFNWDQGPFDAWDLLGVPDVARRLQDEGREVPALVRDVLDRGEGAFYRDGNGRHQYFDAAGRYVDVPERAGVLDLLAIKTRESSRVVATNAGASVVDLGDGIAGLEFHSKMNVLGEDTIRMVHRAVEEVRKGFDGLVVGNQGPHFSAGANLMLMLMEAQEGNWEEIDLAIRWMQRGFLALRYLERPVVAAPFGFTVGGGCELCLQAARIQASAETYMGLVETGMGLIPAGGGTAEMARRASIAAAQGTDADLFPFVRRAFEHIALAKASTSAEEARALGYLREADGISMNGDFLLADAKAACLALVRTGYRPPLREPVRVVGERGLAAIESYLYIMHTGGHITEYDRHVGKTLAHVICGGRVPYRSEVSEEYLRDLEREAFLSLLGQAKTQERIRHFLKTSRPLRN